MNNTEPKTMREIQERIYDLEKEMSASERIANANKNSEEYDKEVRDQVQDFEKSR